LPPIELYVKPFEMLKLPISPTPRTQFEEQNVYEGPAKSDTKW